ncbi:hypothetical protein MSG28_005754 [Choristoneura fumiferana]|uniref:Uncharacterized protein n=1 Tax=Choristoneura fumiferana TaxID=7141 RepID=A0ACC0L0B5_CHOFU|nr:hypothetical protein MSG28_005754 [Choristoneura fumiferana]
MQLVAGLQLGPDEVERREITRPRLRHLPADPRTYFLQDSCACVLPETADSPRYGPKHVYIDQMTTAYRRALNLCCKGETALYNVAVTSTLQPTSVDITLYS